jgi:membrane protease YdiL (CAAX protease family)
MRKSATIERFSVPVFIGLTLLISFAVPLFLSIPPEFVALLLTLVPAVIALLLSALSGGMEAVISLLKKLLQWRVGWRWYVIALGLALALRLVMSLLALFFGWIPSIQINPWSLPQFILIGIFASIGAALEELGWRGYALPRMLEKRLALISALFLGIPWGVVHLSLTLPGMMNANTPWLPTILYLAGLSIVLAWFFIQTRGSLVIPILYHAAQNFFVFINGGMTQSQQLWLLTFVNLLQVIILILLFGVNLQRSPGKEPAVADAG